MDWTRRRPSEGWILRPVRSVSGKGFKRFVPDRRWDVTPAVECSFCVETSASSVENTEILRLDLNLHLPTQVRSRKEFAMLHYALVFLVIALIAGFLGFGGVAFASAEIAKICFFVFLVLFVVSLISHWSRRGAA